MVGVENRNSKGASLTGKNNTNRGGQEQRNRRSVYTCKDKRKQIGMFRTGDEIANLDTAEISDVATV